ncbi:MAG TPA: peptide-methionine (S)-S-oxide reductase MsrA [Candidatus Deferrimicrobium sp.]|nr:peptide-methionine (S)-S-oxide reductase MsrA [Candidatus Deferrimicrobium sp.]
MELATFAAGCFWGVEAAFRKIKGVINTTVGYTGGHYENPSYKDVCTGWTGHAEAVRIEYNPAQVTYDRLLEAFWVMHDPTTPNRQGPDVGAQYRSAIFYHTVEQKEKAIASKKRLEAENKFKNPIVTEITAAGKFYPAEDYHQQYFEKMGIKHGVCHFF